MLRLKGSLRGLRLVSKACTYPRLFSAQRNNEIVVSEVKNLTNVALKLYGQRDLETQIAFLEDLREEELNKKYIIRKFIKKNSTLASTWLPIWISKAVVSSRGKLFPIAVPVDNTELASTVKKDLVSVLVQMRAAADTRTSSELLAVQAADLVDALAKNMNIDHLRDVTMVLQDFVSGKVVPATLPRELVEKGGLFADAVMPILQFVELTLTTRDKTRILAVEKARTRLHDQLAEELTHLLHVVNSSRFHEATPHPVADDADATVVPHAQKESYYTREPRLVKTFADKATIDYHIEHPRDGGMIYLRTESQNAGKIRFGDSYVLSVKAPCYARKKKDDQPGIYDDLNEMLAKGSGGSKSKSKPSKSKVSALSALEDPVGTTEEEGQWQRKVVIDNLPGTITAAELRHALRKCGPVAKVWLYRDERTTPDEVRHMQAHLYAQNVKNSAKGCDPDSSEIVEPEVEALAMNAIQPDEESADGVTISGQEAAAHAAEQQLLPTKHKMLRGSVKTDSYAFVQMADEEGFRKITKDAVRLFGIQMQNKSCRVLMAQTYKGFWVDVGQNQSVAEAIYSLNEMFDGHFECYSEKEFEKLRPIYMHVTFEDATECQRAFDVLLRRMEQMQSAGLVYEKRQWDRHARQWEHLRANLYPSWIKDSWYKEYFDRQSKHMEKKEAGRRLQAEHNTTSSKMGMQQLGEEMEEEDPEGQYADEEEGEEKEEEITHAGTEGEAEPEAIRNVEQQSDKTTVKKGVAKRAEPPTGALKAATEKAKKAKPAAASKREEVDISLKTGAAEKVKKPRTRTTTSTGAARANKSADSAPHEKVVAAKKVIVKKAVAKKETKGETKDEAKSRRGRKPAARAEI